MSLLHGFPTGVLDLMGSMDLGHNVNDLLPQIRPVIDFTPFYLVGKQTTVSRSLVAATALGFDTANQLVVPSAEAWYIHAWSFNYTTLAGATHTSSLMIIQDGTGIFVSPSISLAAATAGQLMATHFPRILTAGTRLGVFVSALAGGNANYGGGLMISRMRA